jgi:hypothetical protein
MKYCQSDSSRHIESLGSIINQINAVVSSGNSGDPVASQKDALILFVHTFGYLATRQPRILALVAHDVFKENEIFNVLPTFPTTLLEQVPREWIIVFLKEERSIYNALVDRMRAWCHSGFSSHSAIHSLGLPN